jgi:hypothetical protein
MENRAGRPRSSRLSVSLKLLRCAPEKIPMAVRNSFFVLNTWMNLDLADHGNPNPGTVRILTLSSYVLIDR